ncbi:MAG TPA: exopolysaccharide biosynthesis protein [Ensifer sp.]|nr:exopolysaccharide biosynthesis protein [Ensifer sp.]
MRTSRILRQIADNTANERVSIRYLLDTLGDRAIGALMLVFAFPNVIPTPPGTSAILGAPLVFLAAQLTFGMRPWLPALIADRSMSRADFARIVDKAHPWLTWAERLLKMRLSFLSEPPFEYFVGLLCLILAVVLLLPVPLGNMLPALTICIFSFGILGRDGVWTLAGIVAFGVSMVIAGGVIYGMAKAAIFFIERVLLA